MSKISLSVVQFSAGAYKMTNLNKAEQLIKEAVLAAGSSLPHLICLPEVFNFRSNSSEESQLAAEEIPNGSTVKWASALANKLNIWLVGGSILEKTWDQDKPYNTCFVINPAGELVAKYRKINLFKIQLEDAPELCEPRHRQAGKELITFDLEGHKVGLAICFDLRFPEVFAEYRKLGCELLLLPSAFTYKTGQAHWEVLCKARAIETQSFFAAPNQSTQANCWGHSLILNPWGDILASLNEENEGFVSTELDFNEVKKVRERLPLRSRE
jgi:deaminated glutathione amidase